MVQLGISGRELIDSVLVASVVLWSGELKTRLIYPPLFGKMDPIMKLLDEDEVW